MAEFLGFITDLLCSDNPIGDLEELGVSPEEAAEIGRRVEDLGTWDRAEADVSQEP